MKNLFFIFNLISMNAFSYPGNHTDQQKQQYQQQLEVIKKSINFDLSQLIGNELYGSKVTDFSLEENRVEVTCSSYKRYYLVRLPDGGVRACANKVAELLCQSRFNECELTNKKFYEEENSEIVEALSTFTPIN